MLATSIWSAWLITQSRPHIRAASVTSPSGSATLIAHTLAPGAVPTTPMLLSTAAANPATIVPWPSRSSQSCLSLLLPAKAVDAASDVEIGMVPLDAAVEDGDVDVDAFVDAIDLRGRALQQRRRGARRPSPPVVAGRPSSRSASGWTRKSPSTSTDSTAESARKRAACRLVSSAANPPTSSHTWVGTTSSPVATAAGSSPSFTITTYDAVSVPACAGVAAAVPKRAVSAIAPTATARFISAVLPVRLVMVPPSSPFGGRHPTSPESAQGIRRRVVGPRVSPCCRACQRWSAGKGRSSAHADHRPTPFSRAVAAASRKSSVWVTFGGNV